MAGHELVTEGFAEGQVGSSAMPHKMNTRSCERVNGLQVVLRGYASMAAELKKTQAMLPPKRPTRLLGTGYIRTTPSGEIWLLGSREKGWGAFGYGFDSWDTLFRAFDVRIVEVGTDEHGPWWRAENTGVTP
jgi:hypothetical protein